MATLKGKAEYVFAVAQQLLRANIHFEIKYDSNGCVLQCKHEATLHAAIDALERLNEKL